MASRGGPASNVGGLIQGSGRYGSRAGNPRFAGASTARRCPAHVVPDGAAPPPAHVGPFILKLRTPTCSPPWRRPEIEIAFSFRERFFAARLPDPGRESEKAHEVSTAKQW